MGEGSGYVSGRPYGTCQRCGQVFRRDGLRKEWTGLWVCGDDFDRKPADMTPPAVRPEGVPIRDPLPHPDPVEVGPIDWSSL